MKQNFIIVLFMSVAVVSTAQTWAPIGATWTFGYGVAFTPLFGYHQWISVKDTMVGGQNCKLLKKYGPLADSDFSDKLITYQDSNKVFLFNTYFNQFTVLYDFNKTAGESWIMKTDSCDLLITVDSTGMDTINGIPLKALYLSSEDYAFNGKVLQIAGHLKAPNPDINGHCYGIAVDGLYYTGLRCYEDTVIGQVNFGIAPDCYYTYSISEINNKTIEIYPNPFYSRAIIHTGVLLENAEITIYNTVGQQVRKIKGITGNSFALERDKLISGIYIIQLAQGTSFVGMEKLMICDE
ncbi:MAG TPA: T9SS type A sorting domain-containing protein [Bacteroidales bacterium]|nr:T9SS type A sorting domain-containing protein [Bacteroidales bacterium]